MRYYFSVSENYWEPKWTTDQVRALLLEQYDSFWGRETGIPRSRLVDLEKVAKLPHAVIISGLRRVGKSTLLLQMAHKLGKDSFYYLNFEDDRFLGFESQDANYLFQHLVELFGERKIFILDEVQNVPDWERFVRRFMDQGYKFYITGSNASLLSRELGTRLTGRYVPIELFPFSFQEYLQFTGEIIPNLDRLRTADVARLNSLLDRYMRAGGIPDAVKYPDLPLLRTLYEDVLYRDIAARYRLDAVYALRELAYYLVSHPAGMVSYNKLKSQFKLGSVNTIKSFVEYMQNSWLIFTMNVYDYSLKRQQIAPKKIYCVDTGLSNAVGFRFSPNTGRLMENLVFLALRQGTDKIYYYLAPDGLEVDFYLPDHHQLIQVAQNMTDPVTRERELRALRIAVHALKAKQAIVLSSANDEDVNVDGVNVQIRSLSEWLLEEG
jgi:predicted AAA+ superfamily ATPase